jgi:hypothetical protein
MSAASASSFDTSDEMPIFSLPHRNKRSSGENLELATRDYAYRYDQGRFDEQYHASSFSSQKPSVSPVDIVQTVQQILALYSVGSVIAPVDKPPEIALVLHHILTILLGHILHYFFHCYPLADFNPEVVNSQSALVSAFQSYPSSSSLTPLQNFQKQILSLLESYIYKGQHSMATLSFSHQIASTSTLIQSDTQQASHFLIITLKNLLVSSSLTFQCTSISILTFLLHIHGKFFSKLLIRYEIPVIILQGLKKNDENIVKNMREVKSRKETYKLQPLERGNKTFFTSAFSLEFCLFVIRQQLSFLTLFALSSFFSPSSPSESASTSASLTALYLVKNDIILTLLNLSIMRFDDDCIRWMKCRINAYVVYFGIWICFYFYIVLIIVIT